MADNSPDIRVRLSPEGVEEVLAALRKIRAESKGASKGAAAEVGVLHQALGELKELLPTIGLAATVLGVIALGKHALETGEEINKMGQRVGATSEELSVFRFAMLTADVSREQLEKGMVRLARNIVELRKGNEQVTNSFEEIGLAASDFVGKNTAQAFALVAERIGKLPDGIEKSALAFDLFGKGGAQLIPLLNDIAKRGFEQIKKDAEDAGLIMSTEFTKAAEEALDQMKLAKAQADALAISFTTGLTPGITEAVAEFRKFTQGGASDGLKQVGQAVGHFLELAVKGFLIFGVTIGHVFALLEQKAQNLKGTLGELSKAFATGNLAFGPIGGVVNAIRSLTSASDPKQQATLDSLGEKIAEIVKGADPAKLGAFKKAVDALNAGDDAGEARAASAKQRLAVVQTKIHDDEIKQLGELAKVGEATNERLIIAERKLADARVAKDAQTAEGQKAIEDAERGVFAARVAGAEDAAKRELAIIDLRTNALLKAAQTEFQTSRELASVKKEIEKQAAEARLAVEVKLFQDLTKLREDELAKARAAASTIIALDKEIAKNKQEAQNFSNRLTLDGLEGEQKVGFANRLANDKLDELRTAALTGNLEKARELRSEVTSMANEIARLGEGRAAERVFDEANSLFELAANARKLQAQAAGDVATKEAERLKAQLDTIKEEIGKQANEIVANVKPKVDQDALKALIDSIQKALATEKFTVQVYPQMAGQTAPGLAAGAADGGPILGYSPHSRADNIPIRATAGEFMQPVRAVQYYGPQMMEAIRTLQFPRFADGGSIGGGSIGGGTDGPAKIVELRAGRASARGMFTREGLHNLNEVLRELALGEDG